MPNINLIGTEPDQIPTNADLGTLAFQDQDYVNVGNLIVATADITTEARIARFSTANALITGGSVTGITGAASTLVVTNFSSANAEITSSASHIGTDTAGAVSRVANVYSSLGNFTDFSTANSQITGTASSWMRGVPIETANLVASGGSIGTTAAGVVSRVANVYATLGDFSALNSANAHLTSSATSIGTSNAGAVDRVANVYATIGNFSGLSTANAQITGGTINLAAGNITAGNIFITDTSIQNYEYNAVTTKSYVDTMLIIFGT